jgi:hypothetical protein
MVTYFVTRIPPTNLTLTPLRSSQSMARRRIDGADGGVPHIDHKRDHLFGHVRVTPPRPELSTRVECTQQFERFRAARFPDDDAIGTAPQHGTEEAAIRDRRQRGETAK